MARDILIGIDAGTSVIKAVAFTASGQQLAVAARPNSYEMPFPGAVEQDMNRTFADTAAVLAELVERVPDLEHRAAALAVTGQGDGTWLVDAAGEPVGGGLLWLDSRSASLIADYMATPAYAAHFERTGSGLNTCMASGQLAWLKRHQPERAARAATLFHCKDWLYFKLTGERVTDFSESNFTFGNFRSRRYEPEILEGMDLADCAHLLPPMLDGTKESRPLTAEAARLTGLPQGLPVVLASIDVVCTAIGGGLYDPTGTAGVSIFGSTGMHMRFVADAETLALNPDRSGYVMCFPMDNAVAAMQSTMAATLNIDWLMDVAIEAAQFAGAGRVDRATLIPKLADLVLAAEPGQALYHPYIFEAGERGPFLDPAARAQFSGLSTRTGFAGLVRAVYEGLALAARDCYLAMGAIPKEIRLGGGAARSRAVRVILASALGAEVRMVDREETGAAGAAMIAAVERGLYPDLPAAAEAWVTPSLGEATAPDPALVPLYARLYEVFRSVRQAMPPAWRELAATRSNNP